ncbi:MAG: flagellar hook-length control protein FliK [Actinomycetota bacterium]|nr:flagellar hook-length control protein FliK [Actinomycetota bacterium]
MISVASAPTQTSTTSGIGSIPSDSNAASNGGGTFLMEILTAVSSAVDLKSAKVDPSGSKPKTVPANALDALANATSPQIDSAKTPSNGTPAKGLAASVTKPSTPQGLDLVNTVIPNPSTLVVASDQSVSKGGSKGGATTTKKIDLGASSSVQQTPTDTSAVTSPSLLVAISQFQSAQSSPMTKTQAVTLTASTVSVGAMGATRAKVDQPLSNAPLQVKGDQPLTNAPLQGKVSPLVSPSNPSNFVQIPAASSNQVGDLLTKGPQTALQGASQGALIGQGTKADNVPGANSQGQPPAANSFEGAINQALNSLPQSVNRPVSVAVDFTQSYSPPTDLSTPLSHIAISLAPHSGSSTTVELSMSPANLGPITATLSVDRSSMTVVLGATNPQTADLLTKHSAMIANELAKSSGLATTIDMSGGGSGGRGEGNQRQNQQPSTSYQSPTPVEAMAQPPQIVITSAHVVDVTL